MITAFVWINSEVGTVPELAQHLLDVDGVCEVYSVAGPYDLMAVIRVAEHDRLAEIVTAKIAAIPGVAKTHTVIAFRTYSRRDLEAMWSIGMEKGPV